MAGITASGGSIVGSSGRSVVIALINGLLPWPGAVVIRGFGGHFACLAVHAGIEFILDIGLVWSERVIGLRICCV